jgi:hypothetical protein
MEFELEQRLRGAPETVLDLLFDQEFLAARAGLPNLGGSEVLEVTRAGTTARVRVRMHFTGKLAPAVTAVVDPAKLTWVDDATFDLAARRGHHQIRPDHYADRLSCTYDDRLDVDGDGARRVLAGTVKVRAFLVGSKVEGAIVGGLRESTAAESALLNDWLGRG